MTTFIISIHRKSTPTHSTCLNVQLNFTIQNGGGDLCTIDNTFNQSQGGFCVCVSVWVFWAFLFYLFVSWHCLALSEWKKNLISEEIDAVVAFKSTICNATEMGSSDSVSKEIISSIKSIFDFYFQLKLTLVCLGVNHNSRKN